MTLSELGARLAARWRTLAVGGVVALLVAVAAHVLLPARYVATAIVHVSAPEPTLVDMTVEESLARSHRVAAEAHEVLSVEAPPVEQLQAAVDAEALPDSTVLRISFRATEAPTAARGADAVAHAYLATRAVDATARSARVDARIVRAMRGVDTATRTALATERARLAVEDDAGGGEVVDTARAPTSPTGPGLLATGLGGLVLGLLLAAPVAASRDPAGRAS